jgi:hypothetical protein
MERRQALRHTALLALCLATAALAPAQTPTQPFAGAWEEKSVDAVCRDAIAKPLAAPTLHTTLTPAQLASCDETKLYFGLGDSPNYPAALACGWYQRAHPNRSEGDMFQGPGILSMLYANGLGVPRDLHLAIRFACENHWSSPAGMSFEVGDLEHRIAAPDANKQPFSLCDNEGSGLAEGNCTLIQTATGDTLRKRRIAALIDTLPLSAKVAYPALAKAQAAFADARSRNEVDLSGTGRAAFSLEEDSRLNDAVPKSKWEQGGTVEPAGIQQTERAWLTLVQAYLQFVAAARPEANLLAVKIELWKLRLHQLASLAPS